MPSSSLVRTGVGATAARSALTSVGLRAPPPAMMSSRHVVPPGVSRLSPSATVRAEGALQLGSYVVKPRDLPLFQIYLRGRYVDSRWLKAGDVTGSTCFESGSRTLVRAQPSLAACAASRAASTSCSFERAISHSNWPFTGE